VLSGLDLLVLLAKNGNTPLGAQPFQQGLQPLYPKVHLLYRSRAHLPDNVAVWAQTVRVFVVILCGSVVNGRTALRRAFPADLLVNEVALSHLRCDSARNAVHLEALLDGVFCGPQTVFGGLA
jgi:hypothetical protein